MLGVIVLLLTFFSFAEVRPSSVALSGTQGPDDFSSGTLTASLGMSEEWAFKISYFYSDSGVAAALSEPLISNELRAGADWQISETWGSNLGVIFRRDPYEVTGRGFYIGGSSVLSDLWEGKRETALLLNYERIRYTQNLTVQGTFRTLEIDREITQESISASLEQELFDWILMSVSYRAYQYSEEANQLAVTTSRRRTSWGGGQSTYGLPEQEKTLGLQINPAEWIEMLLEASGSRLVDGEDSVRTNSLILTFNWRSYSLDLGVARTDFGEASGNDEDKQTFYSTGLSYNW